jgi:hypothetical protein
MNSVFKNDLILDFILSYVTHPVDIAKTCQVNSAFYRRLRAKASANSFAILLSETRFIAMSELLLTNKMTPLVHVLVENLFLTKIVTEFDMLTADLHTEWTEGESYFAAFEEEEEAFATIIRGPTNGGFWLMRATCPNRGEFVVGFTPKVLIGREFPHLPEIVLRIDIAADAT